MAKKKSARRKAPKVFEFTITLLNTHPIISRKVLVHDFIELNDLHMVIQMAMGWENRHLYVFEIDKKTYSDSESSFEMKNTLDTEGVELSDALGKTKNFKYIYDFGDDWVHEIKISNILEHDPRLSYPVCIGGENACPPEDCGGIHGFERLKSILSGKESEEKDEMLTWVGGYYNPNTFDPNFVNKVFLWAED